MLAAKVIFNSGMMVREDTRKAYPERRFIGYNAIDGRLMAVVFSVSAADHIPIISFRKADRREQTKFTNQSL